MTELLPVPHEHWTETFSGIAFDIECPDPARVRLVDIAHHLALENRFGGATRVPYSVAQHSVHVWQVVQKMGADAAEQKQALFHDAKEAYCRDMLRPWGALYRKHSRVVDYLRGEVHAAVFAALGLPLVLSPRVVLADNILLYSERESLLSKDRPQPWHYTVEERKLDAERYMPFVEPWPWEYSKSTFLEVAADLGVEPKQ